jgi:hypothetical protein
VRVGFIGVGNMGGAMALRFDFSFDVRSFFFNPSHMSESILTSLRYFSLFFNGNSWDPYVEEILDIEPLLHSADSMKLNQMDEEWSTNKNSHVAWY